MDVARVRGDECGRVHHRWTLIDTAITNVHVAYGCAEMLPFVGVVAVSHRTQHVLSQVFSWDSAVVLDFSALWQHLGEIVQFTVMEDLRAHKPEQLTRCRPRYFTFTDHIQNSTRQLQHPNPVTHVCRTRPHDAGKSALAQANVGVERLFERARLFQPCQILTRHVLG